MEFDEFKKLSKKYNLIPVYEKYTADLFTPVSAYLNIRDKENDSFLLESVEGIGRLARYSFIGSNPKLKIIGKGHSITVKESGKEKTIEGNITDYIQNFIKDFNQPKAPDLPAFTGGLVGYFGFETMNHIEPVIEFDGIEAFDAPEFYFGLYDTIAAFDHFSHKLIIIHNVNVNLFPTPEEAYKSAKEKIRAFNKQLRKAALYSLKFKFIDEINIEDDDSDFIQLVSDAKKHIYEGDVFQLVLSKRFGAEFEGDSINVYRALRIINPSPYMYFMEFEDDLKIIGTSPEDLLRVTDKKATILPIAGTRKRGADEIEDAALEKELLEDPKEIAEHTMLVDLARNDLGRVCDYDTVEVTESFKVHKFSHVMHIVSRVEGTLKDSCDCIDALKASFPAGTVSGAPKIKAVQLINKYEPLKRNIYSGAIGYIDFGGNLDLCIAIRTLFAKGNKIYWQAGAGIVADSKPELELKEIENKSAVLKSALKKAEAIDEDFSY